jgi:hypothetical protein
MSILRKNYFKAALAIVTLSILVLSSVSCKASLLDRCNELLSHAVLPQIGVMSDLRDSSDKIKARQPLKLSDGKRTAKSIAAYLTLYLGLTAVSHGFIVTSDRDFKSIGQTYERVSPRKILFIDAVDTNRFLADGEYSNLAKHFPSADVQRLIVSNPEDMVTKISALAQSDQGPYDTIEIAAHGSSTGIAFGTDGRIFSSEELEKQLNGVRFNKISNSDTTLWFYSCRIASENRQGMAENNVIPVFTRSLLPEGGTVIGSYRSIEQRGGVLAGMLWTGMGNLIAVADLVGSTMELILTSHRLEPKVAVWRVDGGGHFSKLR